MRQLTNDRYDFEPRWSPDGKQIAFSRAIRREGEIEAASIYVVNLDGSNLKRLTAESAVDHDYSPDWSPDGTKIAFSRNTTQGVPAWIVGGRIGQIWVMDTDGNNQEMLVSDFSGGPTWSTDGKKIAFWRHSGGTSSIYVMDADGANVKRLTDGPWLEAYPRWSRDGREILFGSNRDGDNYDIYIMNEDGSNVRRITTTPQNEYEPDWTAFPYAVDPAGRLKATWGNIKRGLFSR